VIGQTVAALYQVELIAQNGLAGFPRVEQVRNVRMIRRILEMENLLVARKGTNPANLMTRVQPFDGLQMNEVL